MLELNLISGCPQSKGATSHHTTPPSSSIWTEEQLAGLVANEAADIINKFRGPDSALVGVLDHSLLGLVPFTFYKKSPNFQ